MIAQVTAVDLLAEMRVLAHPVSVDSVPTSANQEDHVSMGMAAARKLRRSVECLEYVLGIELLCAAQALEDLKPLRPGLGVERAVELLREDSAPYPGSGALRGHGRLRSWSGAGYSRASSPDLVRRLEES